MRNAQKRDFARRLRRSMTDAEQVLWYHLRGRRLNDLKFRRQFPMGRYVADFACLEAGLVVELDGGQHNGSTHDERRNDHLRSQGFTVLRFWNNDVLTETDAVLQAILDAASRVPSPQPSPASVRGSQKPVSSL